MYLYYKRYKILIKLKNIPFMVLNIEKIVYLYFKRYKNERKSKSYQYLC